MNYLIFLMPTGYLILLAADWGLGQTVDIVELVLGAIMAISALTIYVARANYVTLREWRMEQQKLRDQMTEVRIALNELTHNCVAHRVFLEKGG